jgi:hypothetical protein
MNENQGLNTATLERATALRQTGQHDQAETLCQQLLQTSPNCAAARHSIGPINSDAGNFSAAVAMLEKAAALDMAQPAYHKALADACAASGNNDRAIHSYRRDADRVDSGRVPAGRERGRTSGYQGHEQCVGTANGGPFPLNLGQLTVDQLEELAIGYLSRRIAKTFPQTLRIIDTMPFNIEQLDLIATLFPRAYIVHCRRDPRGMLLECYFKDFGAGQPTAKVRVRPRLCENSTCMLYPSSFLSGITYRADICSGQAIVLDRFNQCFRTQQINRPFHVVCEHMKAHFCTYIGQCFGQEVVLPHPGF